MNILSERQRGRLDGRLRPRKDYHVLGGDFFVVDDPSDVTAEVEGAAVGNVRQIMIEVRVNEFTYILQQFEH